MKLTGKMGSHAILWLKVAELTEDSETQTTM